jgi:hypothetical protein
MDPKTVTFISRANLASPAGYKGPPRRFQGAIQLTDSGARPHRWGSLSTLGQWDVERRLAGPTSTSRHALGQRDVERRLAGPTRARAVTLGHWDVERRLAGPTRETVATLGQWDVKDASQDRREHESSHSASGMLRDASQDRREHESSRSASGMSQDVSQDSPTPGTGGTNPPCYARQPGPSKLRKPPVPSCSHLSARAESPGAGRAGRWRWPRSTPASASSIR